MLYTSISKASLVLRELYGFNPEFWHLEMHTLTPISGFSESS